MLKKIQLTGGCFNTEKSFDLFSEQKRLTFLYGKNGTGKSTISNAVRKAKGEEVDGIESAKLYDENDSLYDDLQSIYVFNEDYISSRVRIKDDGLNSIVLLGELGDLEDKILNIEKKINQEKINNKEYKNKLDELGDESSIISPAYFRSCIAKKLTGNGCWAEREKTINNHKRNASVNDKIIDNIITIQPSETLEILKSRFEQNLETLSKVTENDSTIIKDTTSVNLNYNEDELRCLLSRKIEKPELSEREKYLINLIEEGKLSQISEMRSVFSNASTKRCPFCLQEISSQMKQDLIVSIERVLSEEIDAHKKNLEEKLMKEVEVDFEGMEHLGSNNYIKCKELVIDINKEISKINEKLTKKINYPYSPITNFCCNLNALLEQYEIYKLKLQNEINEYNKAIKEKTKLKAQLSKDNASLAHYEVENDIKLLETALVKQDEAERDYLESNKKIDCYNRELSDLKSQKKNIKIAVDLINKSLRYIFFAKNRLEIKVEKDKYLLLSNGNPVKPNKVSVGERNIIALSYFFTEIITNQDIKDGYSKKLILVIDDPVSSFDLENKVGIMSFLRSKISDILINNEESQILLMTHDIQSFYDFLKIGDEVCGEYKIASNGHNKIAYSAFELKNKEFIVFSYLRRNEYSEIMKSIYEYACGNNNDGSLTIGNMMRRLLEAFSTFTYKKGIEEISFDDTILQQIDDKDYAEYFKNLMYRLVLNGDSHMEERTRGLNDISYMTFLSEEEKRRTAKEVICFIYLLNKRHVLAHLSGIKNVDLTINNWCEEIRRFNVNID